MVKDITVNSDYELKEFGELEAGNVILGHEGQPVTIKAAYEPHVPEKMYEIEVEDGTFIEASGNHLWYIEPDSDKFAHSARLQKAKKLLSVNKEWSVEALVVATAEEPYEIGMEDLMEFFDFITDPNERYYFLLRIAESMGHIVEENTTYKDSFTGEETDSITEKVYDARRFFQQALALTGVKKYKKSWPIIVGRVVTTDTIFHRYPDVDLPTLDST